MGKISYPVVDYLLTQLKILSAVQKLLNSIKFICQLLALFPEQPEYDLGSLSLIVDYYGGLNRSAFHRLMYLSTWFISNVFWRVMELIEYIFCWGAAFLRRF